MCDASCCAGDSVAQWQHKTILAVLLYFRHPGEGRGPTDLAASTQGQLDPGLRRDDELIGKWSSLRASRTLVNEQIEPLRREKVIGSSLEAKVTFAGNAGEIDLAELFIVSDVQLGDGLRIERTTHHKCGRCWRHLPEVTEDGALCSRCDQVVAGMDAAAHV